MKIKFTGYMDIAPEDEPDDRGSVDIWLTNFIKEAAAKEKHEGDFDYEEGDSLFELLKLDWEVVEDDH